MSLVRIWFLLTGGVIALGAMWVFAPILIVVLLVASLLSLLVAGTIRLARYVEARRPPRGDPPS